MGKHSTGSHKVILGVSVYLPFYIPQVNILGPLLDQSTRIDVNILGPLPDQSTRIDAKSN